MQHDLQPERAAIERRSSPGTVAAGWAAGERARPTGGEGESTSFHRRGACIRNGFEADFSGRKCWRNGRGNHRELSVFEHVITDRSRSFCWSAISNCHRTNCVYCNLSMSRCTQNASQMYFTDVSILLYAYRVQLCLLIRNYSRFLSEFLLLLVADLHFWVHVSLTAAV